MSSEDFVAALVAERRREGVPMLLGLCGAQGSGKSTIAARIAARFPNSAILSLDDLYRTRADRLRLAAEVHPLFATRGVPGTHDVALGIETIGAVLAGESTLLPRFDKAADDRAPVASWPRSPRGCELLILEGWCVGASPQHADELDTPVNALEAEEDGAGIWRRHVNAALAEDYAALFAPIDALALLLPPDWQTVLRWRTQQEDALRHAGGVGGGMMDAAQLARFVSHYERLTRHIWREMPDRADLRIRLDTDRLPIAIWRNSPPAHASRADVHSGTDGMAVDGR